MARASAYYQPLYPYYMGRRVPALRLYRMLGSVVLDQLGEVRAVAEALSDRLDVRTEAICRDLRTVDDSLPNVIDERARAAQRPFAGNGLDLVCSARYPEATSRGQRSR